MRVGSATLILQVELSRRTWLLVARADGIIELLPAPQVQTPSSSSSAPPHRLLKVDGMDPRVDEVHRLEVHPRFGGDLEVRLFVQRWSRPGGHPDLRAWRGVITGPSEDPRLASEPEGTDGWWPVAGPIDPPATPALAARGAVVHGWKEDGSPYEVRLSRRVEAMTSWRCPDGRARAIALLRGARIAWIEEDGASVEADLEQEGTAICLEATPAADAWPNAIVAFVADSGIRLIRPYTQVVDGEPNESEPSPEQVHHALGLLSRSGPGEWHARLQATVGVCLRSPQAEFDGESCIGWLLASDLCERTDELGPAIGLAMRNPATDPAAVKALYDRLGLPLRLQIDRAFDALPRGARGWEWLVTRRRLSLFDAEQWSGSLVERAELYAELISGAYHEWRRIRAPPRARAIPLGRGASGLLLVATEANEFVVERHDLESAAPPVRWSWPIPAAQAAIHFLEPLPESEDTAACAGVVGLGDGAIGVLLGGDAGSMEFHRVSLRPGHECIAALTIPASEGILRLAVAHRKGWHGSLEIIDLELSGELGVKRRSPAGLLMPRLDVIALSSSDDEVLLFSGSASFDRLDVRRWELATDTAPWWERPPVEVSALELDSGITQVRSGRFNGEPVLIVGTHTGMIWCFETTPRTKLRWTYRAKEALSSIRFIDPQHVVCTSVNRDLVLLDADGRRFGRGRIGRPVRDMGAPNILPATLLALATQGWDDQSTQMLIYRRRPEHLDPPDPWPEAGALDRLHKTRADAILGARACLDRRYRALESISARSPRRMLLDQLSGDDEWLTDDAQAAWLAAYLPELTLRELGALAAGLSQKAPRRLIDALWRLLVGPVDPQERGDDGFHAWTTAIGEFLRLLRRSPVRVEQLRSRLPALPDAAWEDQWVRTESCLTWLAATPPERRLGALHLLAPAAAADLPLVDPGCLALAELARLVHDPRAHSTPNLREESPPLATVIELSSSATANWIEFLEALRRSRSVPPDDNSPWVRLARILAVTLPPGRPEDTWELSRQRTWLTEALAKPVRLDGVPAGQWWDACRAIAEDLDIVVRNVLVARLSRQVSLVRPRPRIVGTPIRRGQRLAIKLSIAPEGERRWRIPTVTVSRGDEQLASVSWHTWGHHDPAEIMALELPVSEAGKEVNLTLRIENEEGLADQTTWTLPVPPIPHEGGETDALLPKLEQSFEAVRAALLRGTDAVAVLASSEETGVRRLVESLAAHPGVVVVNLDHETAELGPGARFPEGLNTARLNALLRLGRGAARAGTELVIAWPATALFSRLETPDLSSNYDAIVDCLRSRVEKDHSPRLLVCLPWDRAARFWRRLKIVAWHRPGEARSPVRLDEMTEFLQERGLSRSESTSLLTAAASDIHLLASAIAESRTEPPRSALLRVGKLELSRLSEGARLAALALPYATSRIEVRRLERGMIVDEAIYSKPKNRSQRPKTLVDRGASIEHLDSIRSSLTAGESVRCQGVQPGKSPLLAEGWKALADDVGHLGRLDELVRSGLALESGGLVRTSPLLRVVVAAADSGSGPAAALDALGLGSMPLTQLRLRELNGLLPERGALIFGPQWEHNGARNSLRAWGEVWRQLEAGELPAPSTVAQASQLFGQLAPEIATTSHHVSVAFIARPELSIAVGVSPAPPEVGEGLHFSPAAVGAHRLGNWLVLGEKRLREILGASDPQRMFWAQARFVRSLTKLSPFQSEGALRPGHSQFVGRGEQVTDIENGLTTRDRLIIGPRQVGKTSLLYATLGLAKLREDLEPMSIDLQGCGKKPDDLGRKLAELLDARGLPTDGVSSSPDEGFRRLITYAQSQHRFPVFFLNEVDQLHSSQRALMWKLRGYSDSGEARFVMVAYATLVHHFSDHQSPFYHWTSGPFRGKAYQLGTLQRRETLQLLDHLELPPLALVWRSAEEREAARQLLARASGGVAFLVQNLCNRLVQRLEEKKRGVIRLDDVAAVLGSRPPVLDYLDAHELDELAGLPGQPRAQELARLTLDALAISLYELLDSPPDENQLQQEAASHRNFDIADTQHRVVRELQRRLPLLPSEVDRLASELAAFPMQKFFQALCLTLILAPADVTGGTARYCFQDHLYPIELLRAQATGTLLVDRLFEGARTALGGVDT